MAEIDGTGIVFSDSTRLDSITIFLHKELVQYSFSPAAPTGWSKTVPTIKLLEL